MIRHMERKDNRDNLQELTPAEHRRRLRARKRAEQIRRRRMIIAVLAAILFGTVFLTVQLRRKISSHDTGESTVAGSEDSADDAGTSESTDAAAAETPGAVQENTGSAETADFFSGYTVHTAPSVAAALTGEGMTWDASGAVSKAPRGMVIENGQYVSLDA